MNTYNIDVSKCLNVQLKIVSQEGKQGFLINILRRWRYYRSAYIINICPRKTLENQ